MQGQAANAAELQERCSRRGPRPSLPALPLPTQRGTERSLARPAARAALAAPPAPEQRVQHGSQQTHGTPHAPAVSASIFRTIPSRHESSTHNSPEKEQSHHGQ